MRTRKLLGLFAIVIASLAFVFAGCKTQLIDTSDSGERSVTEGLPAGVVKVENGYATLNVNAYNEAVYLATRSILPSIGNSIYFTIVASTRKYGGDELNTDKATEPAYIAHTTYAGHANYAADTGVLKAGTFTDANGDSWPDGMDLAKPFFSTTTGIPEEQTFTLKTNTQWYFTAYGTSKSPIELAKNIGTDPNIIETGDDASTFATKTANWGWKEWTALVGKIQADARIVGDLPLYIADNGNSATADEKDQIQLLDGKDGTVYPNGLNISTDTQKTKEGHFLVPVKVPGGSATNKNTINYVKIDWKAKNDAQKSTLATDGSITWKRADADVDNDQSFAFYPEVGEGNYEVVLNFYNTDPAATPAPEPVYEVYEDTLTVWGAVDSTVLPSGNGTNDNWYGSVTFTDNTIYNATDQVATASNGGVPEKRIGNGYVIPNLDVVRFHRTRYYVSNGTGKALKKANGTATGSITAPFDTIAEAVTKIEADDRLRSTLWYIVVDGATNDPGKVTLTNKKLGTGESGDYQVVIQSYKYKEDSDITTIEKELEFLNKNNDSATSAMRVVLRNIKVNANVNVGTQDLILDNAQINATGGGKVVLMSDVSDTNQKGILNVKLDDTTTTVKNITSTIADPKQVTVLRSYSINYETPKLEVALKNPKNTNVWPVTDAMRKTYVPDTTEWTSRFVLDSGYANVDIGGEVVTGARVLAQNTTDNDEFEGCLTIKSPQRSVGITFSKGLYATDVLSSADNKVTYSSVDGYGNGWVIEPNATYSSSDVTGATENAKITLNFVITVKSLSPTVASAKDGEKVLNAIKGSFEAYLKDGKEMTAKFSEADTAAQYVIKPTGFEEGASDSESQLKFVLVIQGDLIDPDLAAYSPVLWVKYTLNNLEYSSPYRLIIKNSD